jgi:hypothetical protein
MKIEEGKKMKGMKNRDCQALSVRLRALMLLRVFVVVFLLSGSRDLIFWILSLIYSEVILFGYSSLFLP